MSANQGMEIQKVTAKMKADSYKMPFLISKDNAAIL